MFTMEEMLSKRNQRDAWAHFETKKDGCGIDKMKLSELHSYWDLNHEQIEEELRNGSYRFRIIYGWLHI